MDPNLKWVALGAGAFVLLIVYAIVKAAMSGRRRRDAIRDWAFRNGMTYVEGPVDTDSVAKIPQDERPDNLIRRQAWNVVSGRRDRFDISVFDLHQTTGGYDRNTRTYTTRTVVILKMPEELPSFRFMAFSNLAAGSLGATMLGAVEKLAMKIDAGKHGTVVDLPGQPGLILLARDPEATRAVFTPGVIDYFTRHSGYGITTEGSSMLVEKTQTRTVVPAEELEALINDATAVAQQFHQGF